jgi:hypothetical protein
MQILLTQTSIPAACLESLPYATRCCIEGRTCGAYCSAQGIKLWLIREKIQAALLTLDGNANFISLEPTECNQLEMFQA